MTIWTKIEPIRHQVAIAGTVSDAVTGQRIHKALIEITEMPDAFKSRLALQAMRYGSNWQAMVERPDRTQSAIDGHFHFLDLPDGDYTLKASLPSAGKRFGAIIKQQVNVSRNGDRIKHAAADIALPPTGITGKITNAENQFIFMAKVQLEGSNELTFSDSDGNYLISGLEVSKAATVKVSAQGFPFASQSIQLSQGETKTLYFKLQQKQTNSAP